MRTITQSTVGGPQVLHVAQAPVPRPGPGEVLVRVEAIGLNPIDAVVRAGFLPLLGEPPFVLGWDIAGTVETVADDVTAFRAGDRVFGMPRFPAAANAYAEYVTSPAADLAAIPAELDAPSAAALPLAGLTAWQALVDAAKIQAGQRVLIHGGGGGVGHLAVQIAAARGAEVIATASPAKAAFVADLGAKTVIEYRSASPDASPSDLADLLREQAGPVDAVLDTVGGNAAEASLEVLVPGGVLTTITRGGDAELAALVEGAGRRFVAVMVHPDGAALAELAALVTAGRLAVRVERTFPFEEVATAHELLDASPRAGSGRGIAGKLVLLP